MTPYRNRQTPVTKRMAEDMLVRNLAPRTIDCYTYHVDRFARHFGKLPNVLGQEEVHDLIQCVDNPKHRAVLITLYAAGLRLAEVTGLKLPDIDSQRMQLKINGGKGSKDRYVPISPRLLEELTMIYLHCRRQHLGTAPSPLDWLPTRQCPR
jgi:site-specific recombinase XerD